MLLLISHHQLQDAYDDHHSYNLGYSVIVTLTGLPIRDLLELLLHFIFRSLGSISEGLLSAYLPFPTMQQNSLIHRANEIAAALTVSGILESSPGQLRKTLCAAQREQLLSHLCVKPLHGHGEFIQCVCLDDVHTDQSF